MVPQIINPEAQQSKLNPLCDLDYELHKMHVWKYTEAQ